MTNDITLRKCVFCQTVKDEIIGDVFKCDPMTWDNQDEEYLQATKHQEHKAKDNAQLCALQESTRKMVKEKK